MWSVGHMEGLRCGTEPMVQWVQGIVDGDRVNLHTMVGEGCIGTVDVRGSCWNYQVTWTSNAFIVPYLLSYGSCKLSQQR